VRRTYYWLEPNTDLSPEGKEKFRRGLTQLVKYDELPQRIVPYTSCNLIGSVIHEMPGAHLPMWDFDGVNPAVPVLPLPPDMIAHTLYIPSRTPGHWHGYTQEPMVWRDASEYLRRLMDAGRVDPEWGAACLDQGQMFLRKPLVNWFQP
jgi:hypothetical protein